MKRLIPLMAIAAGLTGCGGGSDDTGLLTLGLTDAPVDNATAVVVEFTGIEVKPAGHDAIDFDFDTPRQIDLLALQGDTSAVILQGASVPAGTYEWVRLKVNATADGVTDSYIDLEDGSRHELDIPSGSQTGLKLIDGFSIPGGGAAAFTIDFNLRQSVTEPASGSAYVLRPALRLVSNARAGSIAGSVDSSLVPSGCAPAVYVFSGNGVTPDDIDANPPNPVKTSLVALGSGGYHYTAGFLEQGNYTVAFTCNGDDDNPDSDDVLTFFGTQDAAVAAGQTTTVDFAPL